MCYGNEVDVGGVCVLCAVESDSHARSHAGGTNLGALVGVTAPNGAVPR